MIHPSETSGDEKVSVHTKKKFNCNFTLLASGILGNINVDK